MSWLPGSRGGATALDGVLSLRPDLYSQLRSFCGVFWCDQLVDPVVLELCRLRVAQLIGAESELDARYKPAIDAGLSEDLVAELTRWQSSGAFDGRQRACLAFAEQFVLDPNGIDEQLRSGVREHMSEKELVALCEALALFDGLARLRTIFGIEAEGGSPRIIAAPSPEVPLQ